MQLFIPLFTFLKNLLFGLKFPILHNCLKINFLNVMLSPFIPVLQHKKNGNSSRATSRLARTAKKESSNTYLPRRKVSKDRTGKKRCFKGCFFIKRYWHLRIFITGTQFICAMCLTWCVWWTLWEGCIISTGESKFYKSLFWVKLKTLDLTSQNCTMARKIV